MIEIIGILIAAGDGEDAGEQDLGQGMDDPAGIAPVRDDGREPVRDGEPTGGLGQRRTPPSEVRRPPSKAAVSFLPRTDGNANGRAVGSDMAGVAGSTVRLRLASAPNP
jgi:Mrp family chromosome partitioning ATPase